MSGAGNIPSKRGKIVLDLPAPPSVNRLWRVGKGRVYRSPKYVEWLLEAGLEIMAQKPKLACKAIKGPYALVIKMAPRSSLADADNFIKAISDLLQKHNMIENDRLCRKLLVVWDEKLSVACRVSLRSISSS